MLTEVPSSTDTTSDNIIHPDNKVHGANMGPIWGLPPGTGCPVMDVANIYLI